MSHFQLKSLSAGLVTLLMSATTVLAAAPTSGLDRSGFDPAVKPQDDLFSAANGAWLSKTAIPPDKAEYGTWIVLRDSSDKRVRAIVAELAAKPQHARSIEYKLATFFSAYTDTAGIDRAGLKAAKTGLASIAAIKTRTDLARWFGQVQGQFDTPIRLSVAPDFKDPGTNRARTWQGGLGLPDRDYYLKDDERLAKGRAAYLLYLTQLASLAGEKQPKAVATDVLALETQIAKAHWERVQNRDPVKIYNPMTLEELTRNAPGLNWTAFFAAAGLAGIDRLSVSQPSATTAIAQLCGEVSMERWRQYLKLHLLDENSEVLPKAIRDAGFAFRGTALRGVTAEKPRWQQGVTEINGALGEAVGQIYVTRHFPPEHKARMTELVTNLIAAYAESIDGLVWMSPATRVAAKDKLSKYMLKIGYPDKWRDYSLLEVRAGDALGNRQRSLRFEWLREAAKAGKPVDRAEWGMTPQTVNAYYSPSRNEIVFPAAILQPPFFDIEADDAVNYGAIGAIIGHEISHGFDDQGSRFDGDGKLRNWWSDADRKAFDAVGAKLVAQYEKYEPLPGRTLNGKLTLGENIADLSGLQIAYKAYLRSLNGKPAPLIDDYTGQQRFFLGWAQAWREKTRDERALQLLTTDSHSPDRFRANGAAINHDGFHEAFGTQPGNAMFKPVEERIRIW
jgi:putative endopeptidase